MKIFISTGYGLKIKEAEVFPGYHGKGQYCAKEDTRPENTAQEKPINNYPTNVIKWTLAK